MQTDYGKSYKITLCDSFKYGPLINLASERDTDTDFFDYINSVK